MNKLFLAYLGATLCATGLLFGQGGPIDPADLIKPLSDQWTSYSGDFSGRRYSFLKQVNVNNVKDLSLAWLNTNLRTGCGANGAGGGQNEGFGRGGGGASAAMIVGGLGDGSVNRCGPARLEDGILVVNGIIYASTSYNVFAIGAHDGQLLWQH